MQYIAGIVNKVPVVSCRPMFVALLQIGVSIDIASSGWLEKTGA